MKVKTLENLSDKLDKELSWRKAELLKIKMFIGTTESLKVPLLRAGMALLCAHFEGFIKKASQFYLLYVSEQNLKCELLSENFSAILLRPFFQENNGSLKNSAYVNLIMKCNSIDNDVFILRRNGLDQIISTHSNPKMDVIDEILSTIGIKTDMFSLKKNYIESSLLKNRHRIVHGEYIEVEEKDFVETFDAIMLLMEKYEQLIYNSAKSPKLQVQLERHIAYYAF